MIDILLSFQVGGDTFLLMICTRFVRCQSIQTRESTNQINSVILKVQSNPTHLIHCFNVFVDDHPSFVILACAKKVYLV